VASSSLFAFDDIAHSDVDFLDGAVLDRTDFTSSGKEGDLSILLEPLDLFFVFIFDQLVAFRVDLAGLRLDSDDGRWGPSSGDAVLDIV